MDQDLDGLLRLPRGEVSIHRHTPGGTVPTSIYGRLDRRHLSVEEARVEKEEKLGRV